MAGSYSDVTNSKGEFIGMDLIDNLGDAHEAFEECVDMIQHLTGGDDEKVWKAWKEGYCKKRLPDRVKESPYLFSYEKWCKHHKEEDEEYV